MGDIFDQVQKLLDEAGLNTEDDKPANFGLSGKSKEEGTKQILDFLLGAMRKTNRIIAGIYGENWLVHSKAFNRVANALAEKVNRDSPGKGALAMIASAMSGIEFGLAMYHYNPERAKTYFEALLGDGNNLYSEATIKEAIDLIDGAVTEERENLLKDEN